MHVRRVLPLLAIATFASSCTLLDVTRSGNGLALAARPVGCSVEFFRTRAPEQPYDEVATFHWQSTGMAGPDKAQVEMRDKACELGADAVIVNRDFVPGTQHTTAIMTGTAVKYRAAKAP